jgi:hypothetical protein
MQLCIALDPNHFEIYKKACFIHEKNETFQDQLKP